MNKDQLQSLSLEEMDSVSGGARSDRQGHTFVTIYEERSDNVKADFWSALNVCGAYHVIYSEESYNFCKAVVELVRYSNIDNIKSHMRRRGWKNVSVSITTDLILTV